MGHEPNRVIVFGVQAVPSAMHASACKDFRTLGQQGRLTVASGSNDQAYLDATLELVSEFGEHLTGHELGGRLGLEQLAAQDPTSVRRLLSFLAHEPIPLAR